MGSRAGLVQATEPYNVPVRRSIRELRLMSSTPERVARAQPRRSRTKGSMRKSLSPVSWSRSRTPDATSCATTVLTRTGRGGSAERHRLSSRGTAPARLRSLSPLRRSGRPSGAGPWSRREDEGLRQQGHRPLRGPDPHDEVLDRAREDGSPDEEPQVVRLFRLSLLPSGVHGCLPDQPDGSTERPVAVTRRALRAVRPRPTRSVEPGSDRDGWPDGRGSGPPGSPPPPGPGSPGRG